MSWFDMWQELGDYFTQKTSYETRIRPSNVDTERFHLSISPMPQPKIKENGAIQFFAKLEARAKMPASEQSIHDAMECFISLSELFSTTRGGVLSSMAGILSSIELDKDNEAFAESAEEGWFIMGKWKIGLEINLKIGRNIYGSEYHADTK